MYPNIDSVGLSKIQLILYSKFCAATIHKIEGRNYDKRKEKPTKRVEKKRPILPFIRCDLSTSTSDARIEIKRFPKPIYAAFAGPSTNIEKYTDIWLGFRHQNKLRIS